MRMINHDVFVRVRYVPTESGIDELEHPQKQAGRGPNGKPQRCEFAIFEGHERATRVCQCQDSGPDRPIGIRWEAGATGLV